MAVLRGGLAALWLVFAAQALAADSETRSLELASGEEISAEVFGAGNPLRVLWIGTSFGVHDHHRTMATALARQGMEVWQTDLAESLFLPRGAQTMRDISPAVVADLIDQLSDHGHIPLLLVSSGYGSIPLIRGVHAWQEHNPRQVSLRGVVLFSPYFFTQVPQLGEEPQFIAELSATNVPVYIFQAAKNGNRWHLPAMLKQLQAHAPVYVEIMPGVTSLFYDKDMAAETSAMREAMPAKLVRAVKVLQRHPVPREALPVQAKAKAGKASGLDSRLKPYRGSVRPMPIVRTDINGVETRLEDYQGQITVVNFWASWCRPCVEEIPSLNRLKQQMQGKPFRLISVNYAEPAARIRDFMREVEVDFPVLLDPDGELAGQWKVVAFPSTFVIGPDGRIHYGVNAAIHWDTEEVVERLNALLPNAK